MSERVCQAADCTNRFEQHGRKIFCSKPCQRNHHRAIEYAKWTATVKRFPQKSKCDRCGVIYEQLGSRHRFCSALCRTAFPKSDYTKICKGCSISFTTTNVKRLFCDQACRNRAYHVRVNNEPPSFAKVCHRCGVGFIARINFTKYCSYQCRQRSNSDATTARQRAYRESLNLIPRQWQRPTYEIGDTKVDFQGYVRVKVGSPNKWMPQHRHIMEQQLGRSLQPHENVHHINGDRADNQFDNLELWNTSQPSGQRVVDKIAWAMEFLGEYGYKVDGAAQLPMLAD